MKEPEFEAWLSARFAEAPEPEPPDRLLAAMAARSAEPAEPIAHRFRLRAWRPGGKRSTVVGLAATIVLAAGVLVVVSNRSNSRTALVTASPSIQATPSPAGLTASDSVTTNDGLRLTISTPRTLHGSEDAVPIETTLTYVGPNAQITVIHGDPLVGFGVQQLDGKLYAGPVFEDVYRETTLRNGEVQTLPFVKTGGWTVGDTETQAFIEAYVQGDDLVLPVGYWRVFAKLEYSAGEQVYVEAAVVVDVVAPGSSPAIGTRSSQTRTDKQGVQLSIATPKTQYRDGEAIPIDTTMTYVGTADKPSSAENETPQPLRERPGVFSCARDQWPCTAWTRSWREVRGPDC